LKRRIFSVFFALVLVLALTPVMAVPVAAQDEMPDAIVFPFELGGKTTEIGDYIAEWDEVTVHGGSSSVHLQTTGDVGTGDEARILIDLSDMPEGEVVTLGDIESISWWVSTKAGYSPHIDITMDVDGDGIVDPEDMLTAELACNNTNYTHPPVPGVDEWRQTFEMTTDDGFAKIDGTTIFWVTKMGAGDLDAPAGTLADWQAGVVASDPGEEWPEGVTLDGTAPILKLEIEVDNWIVQSEAYVDDITINGMLIAGQIQDAVDTVASDSFIFVTPGTYDEQVLIDKSLTLQGVGDGTVIQPPAVELTATSNIPWIGGGTGTMSAIVSVETTGGTVIIKDLKIDGSLIPSKATTWVGGLVYLETSGKVEGVTVIGNPALPDRTAGIFAAAITNPASLEVTGCTVIGYNRAGIYALGGEFTADYHHNEINGPGSISTGVPNGMFFLEGAKGSATYNTVTDLGYTGVGEYRSTGIGTYNAGVDVLFSNNEISLVQNAFALSTGTSGTIVEYNNVYNCHTGVRIEANAINSIIQYNDIRNNDFAIRCGATMGDGNEAHFNNFVNNPGLEWTNVEGDVTYIYEGAVCNVHPTFILDATNNWWGNASGPVDATAVYTSYGDAVSTNVDYQPWLLEEQETAATFDKTLALKDGWTLVSTNKAVGTDTIWVEPTLAYKYALEDGVLVFGSASASDLEPVSALYVKTVGGGGVGINYAAVAPGVSSKDLTAGWNLISSGTTADPGPVLSPLKDIGDEGTGLTTLVSQGSYNQYTGSWYIDATTWMNVTNVPDKMSPFDGYWIYMNAAKSFGVISD